MLNKKIAIEIVVGIIIIAIMIKRFFYWQNSKVFQSCNLNAFTPEQISQFESASKRISTATTFFSDSFITKAIALAQPAIESANSSSGDFEVKYKCGGRELWVLH